MKSFYSNDAAMLRKSTEKVPYLRLRHDIKAQPLALCPNVIGARAMPNMKIEELRVSMGELGVSSSLGIRHGSPSSPYSPT